MMAVNTTDYKTVLGPMHTGSHFILAAPREVPLCLVTGTRSHTWEMAELGFDPKTPST